MWHSGKVKFLIDDDDVEGRRRCDGGKDGFEEIKCGVASDVDRFRCCLERPEGLVP